MTTALLLILGCLVAVNVIVVIMDFKKSTYQIKNKEKLKTILSTVFYCCICMPLCIIMYYDGFGPIGPIPTTDGENKIFVGSGQELLGDGVFIFIMTVGLFCGILFSIIKIRDK